MAIDLQRPRAIHVAFGESLVARRVEDEPRESLGRQFVRAVSRSFAVGTTLGVILVAAAHPTIASVALLGVVALVLALLTFEGSPESDA